MAASRVRETLSRPVFHPTHGTIRLNGDRAVMQRAAVGVELRRERSGCSARRKRASS